MTSQSTVSEVAARKAFVTVWWESHRDREMGIDEILPVARAADGLGFGKGRTRVQRKRLSKLLGQLRGQEIDGYRVMPNRMRAGAQMWRLIRIKDLHAERIVAWEAFIPSSEWQEVPDGYPCPPGGVFRMDFQTGKNWARWPALEEVSE